MSSSLLLHSLVVNVAKLRYLYGGNTLLYLLFYSEYSSLPMALRLCSSIMVFKRVPKTYIHLFPVLLLL